MKTLIKVKICIGENTSWYAVLVPFIKYFDKINASHSWIEIETDNYTYVYESVWPKGRVVSKSWHNKTYKTYRTWDLKLNPGMTETSVRSWLSEQVQKEYSLLQLIYMALGNFSKGVKSWVDRTVLNGARYDVCTELCTNFLIVFYLIKPKESLDSIGLKDLELMLDELKSQGVI